MVETVVDEKTPKKTGIPSSKSIWATGRRKESIAQVRLLAGAGDALVNGKGIQDYFKHLTYSQVALHPLEATQTKEKFHVVAKVVGGGLSGQAGAIRHGVARALVKVDPTLRQILRRSGFLTRDPRMKERKKYGQKGARKRFQWTKR